MRFGATKSKNVSQEQERFQQEKWRERVSRVRDCRDLLPNPALAESALQQKLDFQVRRTRTRRLPLPARLFLTVRELMLGKYHRFGRGWLTFARDLYGVRQK